MSTQYVKFVVFIITFVIITQSAFQSMLNSSIVSYRIVLLSPTVAL